MRKFLISMMIIIPIILNISVNTIYADDECVEISIELNYAPGNVYEEGTEGFSVNVSNGSSIDVNVGINYSVTGETYSDYFFSDSKAVNVLSGEEKRFLFSLPQDKYGIYKLNVSAGKEEFSGTFAIIPRYEKQFLEEYTRRGIATQYERGGRTDGNDKIVMDKAGVKHIRDGIIWTKHEKEKGLFDYSYTDLWYDNVSPSVCSIVMGLWYNNPFYNNNKSDKYGVTGQYQTEAYANYARNMARRYRSVSEFEIWNEPDYGSFWLPEGNALDYVNMLKTASVEIKQINPKAGIAAGALSKTGETNFMRGIFEFGGYPYFDAVSVHPYVSPQFDADDEYSVSRYKSYTDLISEYGGWKDIIATEIGWPTHSGGASFKRQAEQLVKQNVIADKFGFNANEWFSFRDAGVNPGNKEDNFGVLKNDYTPKPAFIALCSLNRFLSGAVYCGEVSWLTGAEAHLYIKDGNPVITAWSKGEMTDFSEPGNNTKAFDIYGNEFADISSLPSDGSPVYFVNIDYSVSDRVLSEGTESIYDEFIRKYEAYIPQNVRIAAEKFSVGSNMDIEAVSELLDAHYGCGADIIEGFSSDDIKLLSGMLYDWHRIGETIAKLYLKYEITEEDIVYDAMHEIRKMNHALKAAESKSNTDMLPFSRAISRYAVRFCDTALEVRKMKSNKMKYSYIKMCNDISGNLAMLAQKLSVKEQGQNTGIIISIPSSKAVLKEDTSKINVSVKSYKKHEITGRLCLYASDGTLIASSNTLTLVPLISCCPELEIDSEFYSKATEEYAQLCFMQDDKTAASQKIIFEAA